MPYYSRNFTGPDVLQSVKDNKVWMLLKIPSVKMSESDCGVDYGFSPDPTTFLVAIQTEENGPWRTYCRISLYGTRVDAQLEVLKAICVGVLDHKLVMLSVDREEVFQQLTSDLYRHLFEGRVKLTNQGGTTEVNLDTWRAITSETQDSPDVLDARARGQVVKLRRKYFLTECFKRAMMNQILGKIDGPKIGDRFRFLVRVRANILRRIQARIRLCYLRCAQE